MYQLRAGPVRTGGHPARPGLIGLWSPAHGPGALSDLPGYAAIIGGLETCLKTADLGEIVTPRLKRKIEIPTGMRAPRLYAPPPIPGDRREPSRHTGAGRFRERFVLRKQTATRELCPLWAFPSPPMTAR